ncbi:hypothetical protein V5F44_01105 [Xanthobacter sp. V2C-8]|uniref:hypothetical protein n=2 Tax=Xanthobacter albus TaxID=3119929 RepID=UPI00372783D2
MMAMNKGTSLREQDLPSGHLARLARRPGSCPQFSRIACASARRRTLSSRPRALRAQARPIHPRPIFTGTPFIFPDISGSEV